MLLTSSITEKAGIYGEYLAVELNWYKIMKMDSGLIGSLQTLSSETRFNKLGIYSQKKDS